MIDRERHGGDRIGPSAGEEFNRVDGVVSTGTPNVASDSAHVGGGAALSHGVTVEVHTRDRPLADDVDLDDLAARTDDFVGADIEAICREAAQTAVREHVHATDADEEAAVDDIVLTADHFERAIETFDRGTDRFDADGSLPAEADRPA